MPPADWSMRRAGAQAYQGWRPGSAVEALQGPPYGWGLLTRALATPLDPTISPEQDELFPVQNTPVSWISTTINSASETIISAQPNRVLLIVQNQSGATVAVNYDATANVDQNQGLQLQNNEGIYTDIWCPTGTVHVSATSGPVVVTQGYSAIGNIPENQVLLAILDLMQLLTDLASRFR